MLKSFGLVQKFAPIDCVRKSCSTSYTDNRNPGAGGVQPTYLSGSHCKIATKFQQGSAISENSIGVFSLGPS